MRDRFALRGRPSRDEEIVRAIAIHITRGDCYGADGGSRAALRSGAYYSTMGPEILDLDVVEKAGLHKGAQPGRKIVVRCSPAQSITFKAQRSRGRRVLPAPGELLTEAEYPLSGSERYVRVEITAPDGKKAWSNPLFF